MKYLLFIAIAVLWPTLAFAGPPSTGQTAQIGKNGDGWLCFNNKESLNDFVKADVNNDKFGAAEAAHNAIALHRGQHIRTIEASGSPILLRVRIESGDDTGVTCWVASDWPIFVNVR